MSVFILFIQHTGRGFGSERCFWVETSNEAIKKEYTWWGKVQGCDGGNGEQCMRGHKSASSLRTAPISPSKHCSGLSDPLWLLQHLLTTALHIDTMVSHYQSTTATCYTPAQLKILLQSLSSHHMLLRGLGGAEGLKEKPLVRSAS